MINKEGYLNELKREAALFAAAARQNTQLPVPQIPTCPEWNLTELVIHLGYGHRFAAKQIRDRDISPSKMEKADLSYLNLQPEWLEWFQTKNAPSDRPLPPALIEWFEEGAVILDLALKETDPETAVWNWSGTAKTNAEIYQRQMAIETALHRWDAQNALSGQTPAPVERNLALDGIDLLFKYLPMMVKPQKEDKESSVSYHFHCTDGKGEWLVMFDSNTVTVREEHVKGDVALRGSASSLLLFLWRRISADKLEVFGDKSLIKGYLERVPAM